MVRNIVTDMGVLTQKSELFVPGRDDHVLTDMFDTAHSYGDNCVGLAAVQIGELKRVILVKQNDKFIPFINPTIIKKSGKTYSALEGCLSVDGTRLVRNRYKTVMVSYTTSKGKRKTETFNGFTAQIIQHEVDHLNGIVIVSDDE